MSKMWLIGLATGLGALAAYLLFWPVSITPVRWTPPEAPGFAGIYEPNEALVAMERLEVGLGPESVAIDQAGIVYCGLEDGSIVRWAEGVGEAETLLNIGGRPLGMAFDADGNLIVCDLYGRLLAISETGDIEELATHVGDKPLGLVNDLDIGTDGTVYFSESSTKTTDTTLDLLEHRAHGRLLAYHPDTKETEILLDELYYANGVALSPDESFVLVVETTRYRIRRLWLAGPQKGEDEVLFDNLPGFPDGISCDEMGTFWLALVNPRNAFVDWMLEHPSLRKIVARLPLAWFAGAAPRYGFVLGLDAGGNVLHNFQDPSGRTYSGISCVVRQDDTLYFGSLLEDAVGRLPLQQ
ncbi:SMP-30/gluconolactonase/LRE family protein [Candidatus Bipolaricaulota bacterium]